MEKQIEGSKKRVMVIIDESEHSSHSFMWVVDNLKEFITESPLVILAALPAPNFKFLYGAQFGTAALWCPVKAETILEAGEPYELICNAVQKNNINLLVIGNTSINGTLKRDFLGRLSNYCLNNAKCHVLVVKKPE
ncbi:hypothetical protein POTOM_044484 [Populus tomentosa]|uniref:UspA domain-containing protein n=1 Tax=Populus tomentosa TaxID=118781 RepID=A0A8X7YMD9_POPTO|nr:hypothetical protein POTOM_044484 [Populus tomentosa]